MNNTEKLHMLWSRAAFGIPLSAQQSPTSVDDTLADLLHVSTPLPIEVVSADDWADIRQIKSTKDSPDKTASQMKLKSFREEAGNLGLLWLRQMATTDAPLQEKMALFWHGHFATRESNPYYDQLLLQEFRANALGSFRNLLFAVSKSAAMLSFLNNQQNKKKHPNENFAREVMELFTIGRGNYSEKDIKEAARAFTGWGYDEDGAFIIRDNQHDNGTKTFLGKTGDFNGNDILNMLLDRQETARFITQKIYKAFVNEEAPNEQWMTTLTATFYNSDYNITTLMRAIFSSENFYNPINRGAHIKSPIELLVGLQRTVPVEFENERTVINIQRLLGQQLFFPPNVAGWPGGKAWIDSSTLVTRMRLPEAIYSSRELELHAKEMDAEMTDINKKPIAPDSGKAGNFKVGKGEADWTSYIAYWQRYDTAKLPRLLADSILSIPITDTRLQTALQYASNKNKESLIKTLTIRLMSLPEYQLT